MTKDQQRKSLIVGTISVALVGAVVWSIEFGPFKGRLSSPALPQCDAAATMEMARKILKESPFAQAYQIREFGSPVESGYDAQAERRTCTGIVVHALGQERVQFTIQWHDKKNQVFWVEFDD